MSKKIHQKYDEFVIAENQTEKENLRNEIKDLILSRKKRNSEDYQILGLIDYESENWKVNTKNILKNFKKAVEKDKSNFLAQLYLAHINHDIGNLEVALENYLKVDAKALKQFQIWRYVKLIEQIGYCTYKLGNENAGIIFFKKVLNWYKKLSEDELAVPSELLECLPENHEIVVEIKKIETYL